MAPPPDDRSALASAVEWSSRVMMASAEMVVPGLCGLWVDRQLGTLFLFGGIGFAVGLVLAIWHLIRMTDATKQDRDA